MKKNFLKLICIGLAVLMLACVEVGCKKDNYVYKEGDFALTISVEETTLPRGEDFIVQVRLDNLSGRKVKITYQTRVVTPRIDDWRYPVFADNFGRPYSSTMKSNGHLDSTWRLGGGEFDNDSIDERWRALPIGIHELRFRTTFSVNKKSIEVWSNTVKLTVK